MGPHQCLASRGFELKSTALRWVVDGRLVYKIDFARVFL